MKKFFSILMGIVMLLALSGITGCGAEPENKAPFALVLQVGNPMMTVNGAQAEIEPGAETAPVIVDGRTLVPIRAIIEAMGGAVEWDASTQTATLSYEAETVRLIIGSQTAYHNDTEAMLDTAPIILNGRTMLPIRFIAECFHFSVTWEASAQTITISKEEEPANEASTVLIAYFSRTGNTRTVAEQVQEATGGTLFEIVPVTPYPEDYDACTKQAQQEQRDGYRPPLSAQVENIDQYDTIFIGYPIWWGQLPPPVVSFLSEYDLSGKTVIPFCTHGGSGLASSEGQIKTLCPDSYVAGGLAIRGTNADDAKDSIEAWLKALDLQLPQ